MIARVERRLFETGDELGWETVAATALPPVEQRPEDTVWRGDLRLPSPVPSLMRIVVLEAETYETDPDERDRIRTRLDSELMPIDGAATASTVGRDQQRGFRIASADAIEIP